jgi:hypothetical protein
MTANPQNNAALSVVMVSPDSFGTIRTTLTALRRQTACAQMEVLVVGPPAVGADLETADFGEFASWQHIECDATQSSSEMRVAGIRAASAPVIALTEDHCFPARGWAEALIARHAEPWAGVGALFKNANPGSAVSWANFLIEYGDWIDPQKGGEIHHIGGHNSSYKKELLLAYGDRLPEILQAESAMQWDLATRGGRFYLEPQARMIHLNFARFGPSIKLRYYGGRLFAANRARDWGFGKRLLFTLASPLIPLIRSWRSTRTLVSSGRSDLLLRVMPISMILLAFDGLGEMVGYASGAGNSMQWLTGIEFHRQRFLKNPRQDTATALATAGEASID